MGFEQLHLVEDGPDLCRGWTIWPLVTPSNPNYSMLLWLPMTVIFVSRIPISVPGLNCAIFEDCKIASWILKKQYFYGNGLRVYTTTTLSWAYEFFGKVFPNKWRNKHCNLNICQILENYLLYMARRLWSSYKPKTEKSILSILKHYVFSGHIFNEGIAGFVLHNEKQPHFWSCWVLTTTNGWFCTRLSCSLSKLYRLILENKFCYQYPR